MNGTFTQTEPAILTQVSADITVGEFVEGVIANLPQIMAHKSSVLKAEKVVYLCYFKPTLDKYRIKCPDQSAKNHYTQVCWLFTQYNKAAYHCGDPDIRKFQSWIKALLPLFRLAEQYKQEKH